MIKKLSFILILYTLSFQKAWSQITVINSSFEDAPADATTPHGWIPCEEYTTPDILPGYWGVYLDPSNGNTYAGIITRDNGTWESIGQRTSDVLKKGNCYSFGIDLAFSKNYAGYNNPLKLRVWLGSSICDKSELIFESPVIDKEEWQTMKIKFKPSKDIKFILFEAFYKEGEFNYKGNILMDNMSIINDCDRV